MPSLCRCLLVLLLLGRAAAAQPSLLTAITGFTDVNGNGSLDCGEPVTVTTTFATNNSGAPALTGTLNLPSGGTTGLAFIAGSVVIDPDLTNGCQGTITRGNSVEDPAATVTFSCPADPVDSNSWTLVVAYRAGVTSTTSSVAAAAQASISTGATYQDTATHSVGTPCSGAGSSLSMTKTSAGSGLPGSVLVSTLTVHDLSGLGQGGLVLVETIPALTTFDPAASTAGWTCSGGGGAGSVCALALGNVSPNGSASAFLALTLDSSFPAGTTAIVNTACVREGPSQVAACATSSTPTAGHGVLHFTKTLTSGTGTPGATLRYLLTASNSGNQGLSQVTLTETVPAATTFAAAASDAGWACVPNGNPGASCTLAVGGLAPGQSASHTFGLTIANPLPTGTTAIANTACSHDPSASDACDTAIVPTTGAPTLKLTKTLSSGTGTPGATLVYLLTVSNSGTEGATAVTLSEAPPAAAAFAVGASSTGWSCVGTPATCSLSLGTLAAGASATENFAVTLPATFPAGLTTLTNTACAELPGISGSPSCDTLSLPATARAVLQVAKTYSGGPLAAGALLPYQLTVANAGNQDATGVHLDEIVPAHTQFVAASSSPGWVCVPGPAAGAACSFAIGALAAGSSVSAGFAVRADTPLPAGLLTVANSACASDGAGDQGCGNAGTPSPVNVTATLEDSIGGDIHPLGHPGDRIDYSLVVANPSASAATALLVAAELDPHLTLDIGSVSTTGGSVTSGNSVGATQPSVSIASLAAGAAATITFSAHVASPLPSELRSVATQAAISGTDFESTVSDDPDTPAPLDPTVTPLAVPAAPGPEPVPTLSGPGLGILAVVLTLAAWLFLRRRRAGNPRPEDPEGRCS